jgi:A/G-specific adenine glycosylase
MCAWREAATAADPAQGSAGVSRRQAPYSGSARQARGRVLAALAVGPVASDVLHAEIVAGLVADGLVASDGSTVRLAGDQEPATVTEATISSNTASA